ncbi:MAG TPA: thiamine-phosphate kinase [Elusimicrobiota bacterium]|nr:thiamine-phosphate kinase [Elusimicrobiota bacterium]
MTTFRQAGEWGFLKALLPALNRPLTKAVAVGPGDDAAAVACPFGRGLAVITTDMMVEGVHFERRWTTGEDLGYKLAAMNLSDLAAMGRVRPAFGVVSLGLPPSENLRFADGIRRGLQAMSRRHGFQIVGGDTVRSGKIVVSLAAVGWAGSKRDLVLRSGARPGDVVCVTGTLGDAAAGLRILQKNPRGPFSKTEKELISRFLRPRPRLSEAAEWTARKRLSAMIDSSDGLWRSVLLLARASGVGARLDVTSLPVSAELRRWASENGIDPLRLALEGGEDYELVVTVPGLWNGRSLPRGLRAVGIIVDAKHGVRAWDDKQEITATKGYEHFQ